MTKADLVDEVVRVSDLSKKQAETIVNTVFASIVEALQGVGAGAGEEVADQERGVQVKAVNDGVVVSAAGAPAAGAHVVVPVRCVVVEANASPHSKPVEVSGTY